MLAWAMPDCIASLDHRKPDYCGRHAELADSAVRMRSLGSYGGPGLVVMRYAGSSKLAR